jgi:lipoprotein Spr
MRCNDVYFFFAGMIIMYSCNRPGNVAHVSIDTGKVGPAVSYSAEHLTNIETGKVTPLQLVAFANSLKGVPYKYGSTNVNEGFDCSGFVTYVFNHFGIAVPRASVDFTPVQQPIDIKNARPGDLILFTGTDSTDRVVGHMGIITSNYRDTVKFIHSTSGKGYGVVETPFEAYYKSRYLKTIRVFKQNGM